MFIKQLFMMFKIKSICLCSILRSLEMKILNYVGTHEENASEMFPY